MGFEIVRLWMRGQIVCTPFGSLSSKEKNDPAKLTIVELPDTNGVITLR